MTKVFFDTASADEIREFLSWGIGDGVTTNQKIFLSEGSVDFKGRVLEICRMKEKDWPVSVETTTKSVEELVAEAKEYAGWHKNVVVKVAMDKDGTGLKVVKKLHDEGIKTNMPVMVTMNQLFLVAKAGATYVSLFFDRARGRRPRPGQDHPRDNVVPQEARRGGTDSQEHQEARGRRGDSGGRGGHRDNYAEGYQADGFPSQDLRNDQGIRRRLDGIPGEEQACAADNASFKQVGWI